MRGMSGPLWVVLVAGAMVSVTTVVLAVPDPKPSCTASVSAQNKLKQGSETDAETTVTVTLSNPLHEAKFKDLHITPPKGKKLPEFNNPTSGTIPVKKTGEGGSTQNWKIASGGESSTDGGVTVYADSAAGFDADGTFELTIDFKEVDGKSGVPRSCNWTVTDNGQKAKDDTPIATDGENPGASFPTFTASMNGGEPKDVAIYAATTIPCQAEPWLAGASYTIYTSLSLSDWADPKRIGINDTTDAVPGAWNLTWQNSSGVLAANGAPQNQVSLTVPNDPTLVGHKLYAVFAVLNSEGGVKLAAPPIAVSIVAPQ